VVAYPTVDRAALRALAGGPARDRVTIMVDSAEHLDLVAAAAGPGGGPVRVAIDVDAGWRPLGGHISIGAKRSPLRTPAQAAALAHTILQRPEVVLDGLMSYESHIAGIGDRPPGRRAYGAALGLMQRASARELARRRAAVVAAVRAVAPLRFVNGGGTGSLESTRADPAVTELTAGSGLFASSLFDTYSSFTPAPAAFFALPVVRRPDERTATALGGGYVASGGAGRDRLPRPALPRGLRLDGREGAGEVQTPLLGPGAAGLRIGDRAWFRHAKAGELCERFEVLHLLSGDELAGAVPTYRGEGRCFL
jgi:D-serine deaminase-like pyridoxal phosphate-dependent protein